MAIEIGRVCIKTAGRDAGNYCVVVDAQDDNFVLIDGGTRRRKCNILHLEPTTKQIELSKGASHEAVAEAFKGLNLPVWETKPKTKQPRPLRKKKVKEKLPDDKKGKIPAQKTESAPETVKEKEKKPALSKIDSTPAKNKGV